MRSMTIVLGVVAALLAVPGTAIAKDRDHDGMPDRWEKQHGLSATKANAGADIDGDGLTNRQEFRCHTKPRVADSDGDHREDADEDPDRDRVDNGNEMDEGTRPFDRDSDNDGTRDGREDPDHDKLVNTGEDETSNDPTDPDTDDDGIKDGKEHAGAIVSFEAGVLKIDLANGDRVTGIVTDATEIDCESEDRHEGSDEADDDHAKVEDASDEPSDESSEEPGEDHDGEHGDDERDDEGESSCGPADLQPGVAVHEAEARLGADGLVFTQIELVR